LLKSKRIESLRVPSRHEINNVILNKHLPFVTSGTLASPIAIQFVLIFLAKFPNAHPLPYGNQFIDNKSIITGIYKKIHAFYMRIRAKKIIYTL
jgi:hypothetical protein